jgi:molybdopterin converting factor subunit 1
MTIEVKLFAGARQRIGRDRVTVQVDGPAATAGAIRRALLDAHPELEPLASGLRLAVDNAFADDATVVPPGAEVALIPPVSGG